MIKGWGGSSLDVWGLVLYMLASTVLYCIYLSERLHCDHFYSLLLKFIRLGGLRALFTANFCPALPCSPPVCKCKLNGA